jgi:hypothetical protein
MIDLSNVTERIIGWSKNLTESKHFVDDLPAYALGVLTRRKCCKSKHTSQCVQMPLPQAYLPVVDAPLVVAMSAPGAELNPGCSPGNTQQTSTPHPDGKRCRFQAPQLSAVGCPAVILPARGQQPGLWQRMNQLQRRPVFISLN